MRKIRLEDLLNENIKTGFQARIDKNNKTKTNLNNSEKEMIDYNIIQTKNLIKNPNHYNSIATSKLDKIYIPKYKTKFINKYLLQKNDILYCSRLSFAAFLYTEVQECKIKKYNETKQLNEPKPSNKTKQTNAKQLNNKQQLRATKPFNKDKQINNNQESNKNKQLNKTGQSNNIEQNSNTIPSSYFYILRPETDIINPVYLCWILNHNCLKPYIQKSIIGTALPIINKQYFKNIKIPVPNKSTQQNIAQLLQLKAKERQIQNMLNFKKDKFMQEKLNELLTREV